MTQPDRSDWFNQFVERAVEAENAALERLFQAGCAVCGQPATTHVVAPPEFDLRLLPAHGSITNRQWFTCDQHQPKDPT